MDKRAFLISTGSALGLSLTGGCADPLIGSWDLASITSDGETMEFPYNYTYEGDYADFSVDVSGSMVVATGDEGMTATFTTTQVTTTDGEPETETDSAEGTATKTAKGAYDIAIDDVTIGCALADDVLTCTSEEDTIVFNAAADE